MRRVRFKEIQRLISQEDICSQEILISKLNELGINITQATLSRDLAYLKVGKVFVQNKGYIYVLPQDLKHVEAKSYPVEDNMLGVLSVKFSRNIVVINTLPGYATPTCVSIDGAKMTEVLGTVAGDDTILVVLDENINHDTIKKKLLNNFPALKDRIWM